MNLRKLLCGLLALCLLLTMAPAALMEEAPVEEQVVSLGGDEVASDAVDAEDYSIITDPPTTYSEFDIVDNMKVNILKGKTFTAYAPYGWTIAGTVKALSGGKYVTLYNDTDELEITGDAKGEARLQVFLTDGDDTISCVVNVTVTTAASPENLVICDEKDGTELKKKTIDVADGPFTVRAIATKPSKMAVTIKQWLPTTSKIITVYDNGDGTADIVPLKTGTETVKAIAANGKTATLKVTVKDKTAPTKVKIITEDDKKKIGSKDTLDMTVEVYPLQWNAQQAKWTVNKSSVAYLVDTLTGKNVDKTKYYEYVTLVPRKSGKVKVTATAYNDKKATVEIEITDAGAVKKFGDVELTDGNLDMVDYVVASNELMDVRLYDEILTTKPSSPKKNYIMVEWALYSEDGNYIDPYASYSQRAAYTKTKWTSSNKDVATVSTTTAAQVVKVNLKGTGKATITGETENGKKFSFRINVYNPHGIAALVALKKSVTVYTNDEVDLSPYFMVVTNGEEYWGKFSIKPHHTSMVKYVSGTRVAIQGKTGNAKVDVKFGDKKITITLKIKKP